MNRLTLRRTRSEEQGGRIDRFIASRNEIGLMRDAHRRHSWQAGSYVQGAEHGDPPFFQEYKKKKFIRILDEVFVIPHRNYNAYLERPWPCAPRKRGYLGSSEVHKVWPTDDFIIYSEAIDWSVNDVIVIAAGNEYKMWSCSTKKDVDNVMFDTLINCCKFDPTGKFLLIGTRKNKVILHDIETGELVSNYACFCNHRRCSIISVDWSPKGKAFVSGCEGGAVTYYSRSTSSTHGQRISKRPITLVRISPNDRYLAVSALDLTHVKILNLPNLEVTYRVQSETSFINAMAWHPWKRSLLGIGSATKTNNPQIIMFNAATQNIVKSSLSAKYYSLETLAFSKKSGELIITLYHYGFQDTYMVVMSDLDTVVDTWGEGNPESKPLSYISFIVFNPDGTKFATLCSGDSFLIWNFLPQDSKKDANKIYTFPALSLR